jgi:acetylornithine aminotransferase
MAISHWPEAVAVLLEPVQGEGGVKVPEPEFLAVVRSICTQRKLLMMLDEVQTGVGRTGQWFAFQHQDELLPDVMTLAKGLGNGMPIGACLVAGSAVGVLQTGNHGSTFGGNPLACSAALAVIETVETEALLNHAQALGKQMLSSFKQRLDDEHGLKDGRGLGMMFGLELTVPCAELVKLALAEGLLINVTADSVVRLLPPLVINAEEADLIVDKVCRLVLKFLSSHAVESVA